jgi:hypothetical protein
MPFKLANRPLFVALATLSLAVVFTAGNSFGQPCTTQPPLQNYTGGGSAICPCFVEGEEAGAVLTAPPGDYPLEILRVGIAWASQFGTSGNQIQDAIHIYTGGLPTPGPRIFTLPGPVLTDGAINEWNLEPLSGEIIVNSGAFTVTLEFLIANSGDIFAPSMMMDGNGCQNGKNVVKAVPGGWFNGCSLGLSGDWVVYAIYRPVCQSGVGEEKIMASVPAVLQAPYPNPFSRTTDIEFLLAEPGRVSMKVFDIRGSLVAQLADRDYEAGRHAVAWDGTTSDGMQLSSGVYIVEMTAGSWRSTQKVLLSR